MKKIFTLIILAGIVLTANAQHDYNMHVIGTDLSLSAGTLNIQGDADLKSYAASLPASFNVWVNSNVDGYEFSLTTYSAGESYDDNHLTSLQVNGVSYWDANTTNCGKVISVNLTGAHRIGILCRLNDAKSSGEAAQLRVYAGTDDAPQTTELGYLKNGSDASDITADYDWYYLDYNGSASNIYIGTETNGVEILEVQTTGTPTAISNLRVVEKQVVRTTYYSINGVEMGESFEALQRGIYIKNEIYEDGTSKATKVSKTIR